MTTLADEQSGLLALLKGRRPAQPSPYLDEVAASPGLRVVRWIALSWRELHVLSSCPLTSGLLRWEGTWRREIDAFNAGEHPSAAVEDLRDAFLDQQVCRGDRLAAPLAALERALLAAATAEPATVEVRFDWDPAPLVAALARGDSLDGWEPRAGRFLARVGPDVPGLLSVVAEPR